MIKPVDQMKQEKTEAQSSFEDPSQRKKHWGEKLARNLAVAGMLALVLTALRSKNLPSGETVLTAVQEMVHTKWDNQLGKISFVSNLFPETVSVFFESPLQTELTAPCFGNVVHGWTEAEPYLGYASADNRAYAVGAGQVMSVSHGLEEERIIRVRQEDGLETMYYNLASTDLKEGDQVTVQTCMGTVLDGKNLMIEVRRAGRAIDPTGMLSSRKGKQP